MPRPESTIPPSHHLDLNVTVHGDRFALSGVFRLEDGLRAFDHWFAKLNGDVLSKEQLAALKVRAERSATRLEAIATSLETLDAETP